MKRIGIFAMVLALVVCSVGALHATTISFTPSDLGGGRWEYAYQVQNNTLAVPIEELTVYFDHGLYDNLAVDHPKPDWDAITVNPVLVLGVPQPGFYDVLALISGIATGTTEGGFRVSFDWLGAGKPGSQSFDIVNPLTFATLDSGTTSPVPLPPSLFFLASGLLGVGIARRVKPRDSGTGR